MLATHSLCTYLLIIFYFCRTASKFCCHITKLLGITWKLRGAENLQGEDSCVIISNHQSSLDVLGMFNIWVRKSN